MYLILRFYWSVVMAGLLFMMIRSTRTLLLVFLYNPLSFSVDTNYLHWNTTFPAVSLCQVANDETMSDALEKDLGANRDFKLDAIMADLVFFGGNCFGCEDCTNGRLECPQNLSSVADRYRLGCDELLSDCSWHGRPFDCCQLFLPLHTEFGLCYSINSRNTVPLLMSQDAKLISNRRTGPGALQFRVKEDLQIFLHDPYSVPFAYSDRSLKETLLWGMTKEIIIRIVEMENSASVRNVPIERRGCRFPWEIPPLANQPYRSYSFSSCSVECYRKIQLQLCNCTHHLMPTSGKGTSNSHHPSNPVCDYKGLTCLSDFSAEIATTRKRCDCMASCVEPEYSVLFSSDSEAEGTENNPERDQITVRLLQLPSGRFVRSAAKSEMDLFISLGGLAGLFFGISLLSLVHVTSVGFRAVDSREEGPHFGPHLKADAIPDLPEAADGDNDGKSSLMTEGVSGFAMTRDQQVGASNRKSVKSIQNPQVIKRQQYCLLLSLAKKLQWNETKKVL
ncbi:sodium channel protein Nach [Uranotaenia lowii]|uniref:sodium channel protein Nach n=1 Tax=Uranotaenia lowii TaxID=190385 RepID=UPI00247A5B36|nr:sodium channel protein Nach [Uranotaenia lowii]